MRTENESPEMKHAAGRGGVQCSALTLLAALLVIGGSAQGAVYNGSDNTATLFGGITNMTYTGTLSSGSVFGADIGDVNQLLTNSAFLDGNFNHWSSDAPIASGTHWNGFGPLDSGTWVVDFKQSLMVHGLTLYAGSGNTYWGMLQTSISLSTDGSTWTNVASTAGVPNYGGSFASGTVWTQGWQSVSAPVNARYLRIVASDHFWAGNEKLDQFDLFVTLIPEPQTIALLGLGGALLWRRLRGKS